MRISAIILTFTLLACPVSAQWSYRDPNAPRKADDSVDANAPSPRLALLQERQANLGKDDPDGYCLPPGVPRVNGVPFPQKIVQTPAAIVILYEMRTTFRQIFLDNAVLVDDSQPTCGD